MLDVGVSKQLIACYYRYQDKLFTKVNSCCLGFLCLHLIRFGAPEKSEINSELDQLKADGVFDSPCTVTQKKKRTGEIKALCLHICHDCNLR